MTRQARDQTKVSHKNGSNSSPNDAHVDAEQRMSPERLNQFVRPPPGYVRGSMVLINGRFQSPFAQWSLDRYIQIGNERASFALRVRAAPGGLGAIWCPRGLSRPRTNRWESVRGEIAT